MSIILLHFGEKSQRNDQSPNTSKKKKKKKKKSSKFPRAVGAQYHLFLATPP